MALPDLFTAGVVAGVALGVFAARWWDRQSVTPATRGPGRSDRGTGVSPRADLTKRPRPAGSDTHHCRPLRPPFDWQRRAPELAS